MQGGSWCHSRLFKHWPDHSLRSHLHVPCIRSSPQCHPTPAHYTHHQPCVPGVWCHTFALDTVPVVLTPRNKYYGGGKVWVHCFVWWSAAGVPLLQSTHAYPPSIALTIVISLFFSFIPRWFVVQLFRCIHTSPHARPHLADVWRWEIHFIADNLRLSVCMCYLSDDFFLFHIFSFFRRSIVMCCNIACHCSLLGRL